MKLSDLKSEQVVTYRIGRYGLNGIDWGEWRESALYISRRVSDNTILIVTPREDNVEEFRERDYCRDTKTFCGEMNVMQIEGLE